MNTMTRAKHGLLINANIATLTDNADAYGAIENAAMAWRNGEIIFIGKQSELAPELITEFPEPIDAQGSWVTPALIDCHTHLVFAGNRAPEFEQRLQGASYQDIAKAGGGIMSTVKQTRRRQRRRIIQPKLAALASAH